MPSLLEQLLSLRSGKPPSEGLAGMLGLGDVGRHPYDAPPQADINGPIDEEAIKNYLSKTGPIYPQLPKINPEAWAALVEQMPESINVEDRRGRRKDKKQ